MTGFIRRLIGSRQAENSSGSNATPKNTGAYYLNPDDAKTFGDIDYMRTSKTVKRTFPKGGPRVRSVSSDQDVDANAVSQSTASSSTNQTFRPAAPLKDTTAPKVDSSSDRRAPDNSMDMFRNMAKDIRKK